MFWNKVVILISFLFTAKRTLMMSSSPSRSGSRSRSRSRSRGPTRRRTPRSRSPSGSEGESYGGSGQDDRRGSSRSRSMKDRARKRRRSRTEDLDTPRRHVNSTRHAEEESSDTSEVDDEGPEDDRLERIDRSRSRSKKIRKVDVSNPLSTFRKQVRQRKRYLQGVW